MAVPEHVIKGCFVRDVDGFFYFWPGPAGFGHFSAANLREIADELDKVNADIPSVAEIEQALG